MTRLQEAWFVGECADGTRTGVYLELAHPIIDGLPSPECGMCRSHYLQPVGKVAFEAYLQNEDEH